MSEFLRRLIYRLQGRMPWPWQMMRYPDEEMMRLWDEGQTAFARIYEALDEAEAAIRAEREGGRDEHC